MFASGPSRRDCVFIGRRNRPRYGMTAADGDFWVIVNQPLDDGTAQTYLRWGHWKNFLTGIWRSMGGVTYLSDATLPGVHIYDDVMDQGRSPRDYELDMLPEGVWGLDEQNVFAWGTRKGASGAHEYPIYRWDGRDWHEMPRPGFAVTAMHGISPELIYAAGWQGGVARWDGRGWSTLPLPTGEVLTDVFVAGPDEIYATGMNGSLLEGSASGWHVITRTRDERLPFTCVAKWQGELYVGAGPLGLFRRQGASNVLDHIKPNICATSLDARVELVITCDNRVSGTDDGQNFRSSGTDLLQTLTSNSDIANWP
jgi:hypothetical protein